MELGQGRASLHIHSVSRLIPMAAVALVLAGCGPSGALKTAKTDEEASAVSPQYAAGLAAYVKGDYTTALRLWRPIAEQGVAEAQLSVADIYKNNLTPPEYVNAVKWYRKAAEQGNPKAQMMLGIMYARGMGVPENDVLAHMWLNLGTAGAVTENDRKVGLLNSMMTETKMTTGQIAEAQRLASEWKPK